jgi:hypothetical protein
LGTGVGFTKADESWTGACENAKAPVHDDGLQPAHYSVCPENVGQGPVCWVVVQPDGSVWGYSAAFNPPTEGTLLSVPAAEVKHLNTI